MKRLVLALTLLVSSASFLGKGTWIFAKAQVAQVLLARAWDETRAGGRAVKPWPWADTWPVARLTVPRLDVDEIVLAGGHGQSMAFGPGHLSRSATPGGTGNVVLAGHRDTHFRFLRDLRPGDEILLEAEQGPARRYRVKETAVVDFRDRRPLAASPEPNLTLITCYPFDSIVPGGPWRYVVRAAAPVSEDRAAADPACASSLSFLANVAMRSSISAGYVQPRLCAVSRARRPNSSKVANIAFQLSSASK